MEIAKLLTEQITSKGLLLNIKNNTVFAALEVNNSTENFQEIARALSSKINNELILVKNKLRPLMNDVAELITSKLAEVNGTNKNEYDIVVFDTPSVVEELFSSNMVLERRDPNHISNPIAIPTPEDEITKYFTHSTVQLDVHLKPLRDAYGEEGLIALWDKYLNNISETNVNINTLGVDPHAKLNDLILLMIAVGNITEEKPAGVGLSDDKYRVAISEFYGELSNFIAIAMDKINTLRAARQLVIEIKDNVAVVDGVLYQEFLNNGGSPDAILGLVTTSDREFKDFNMGSIVEKLEEYTQAWVNHVKITSFQQIDQEIARRKALYSIILRTVYEEILPDDLKEILGNDHSAAHDELQKLIEEGSKDYILDTDAIARDIIGICMFPNTNFSHFANGITEYVKVNPSFTPSDAATFASIDFIIDYMLEQVYLGGVNGEEVV